MKDQRKTKVNLCTIEKVERGNYIEPAFNSFGITDDELVLNLALRLSKHIKEVPPINWCPTVEQNVSMLLKLLSAIKKKHGHTRITGRR